MAPRDHAVEIFDAASCELRNVAAVFAEHCDPEAIIAATSFRLVAGCFERAASSGYGEDSHHEVVASLRLLAAVEAICDALSEEGWLAEHLELQVVIDIAVRDVEATLSLWDK